jgi:hypothetical protein
MKENMSKEVALVESLVAGIQKHLSTTSSLSFAGQTTTPAALIALLTAFVSAMSALLAARAQTKNAQASFALQANAVGALVKSLKAYILATYTDVAVLADFGLAPRKAPKPLTAAALTLRAQRAAATRKARGTLGKAEKAKIHGVVATPASTAAVVTGSSPAKPPS